MNKNDIGGGSSNIGTGCGDVDPSWVIPDGDGVTGESNPKPQNSAEKTDK